MLAYSPSEPILFWLLGVKDQSFAAPAVYAAFNVNHGTVCATGVLFLIQYFRWRQC